MRNPEMFTWWRSKNSVGADVVGQVVFSLPSEVHVLVVGDSLHGLQIFGKSHFFQMWSPTVDPR